MKSRDFDRVKPYTYWIKDLRTGIKYVGLRFKNVKLNRTPLEDFGVRYFTSGKLKKDFKENPNNFKTKLLYTYDSIDEAREGETDLTSIAIKKNRYANKVSYPVFIPTKESREKQRLSRLGKKLSEESKRKVSLAHKGKPGRKYKHSEESKKLMSEVQKKRYENNPFSEETKRKMSLARIGIKRPMAEETKRKLSLAHKGKSNMQGKKHSEETKRKMSEVKIGKKIGPFSEETKRKMSLARTGRVLSKETRDKISKAHLGRTMSDEARRKLSLAKTGIKHSEESIRKRSLALKGRKKGPMSEETKRKLSLALKGRKKTKENKIL